MSSTNVSNKKALLIGCNYTSSPQMQLRGCINDIIHISGVLMDSFDYDRSNITLLRDDSKDPNTLPTKANIMNQLNNIINESDKLSEIWIQYSGHGSQVRILNKSLNIEEDNLDEVIVPIDYQNAGLIVDDEILNIVKRSKCPTILLFDCCHSGSICDLEYTFDYNSNNFKRSVIKTGQIANPNIFCFSGCKDTQTSADAFSQEKQLGVGAFTDAFIRSLRDNHMNVDIMKLYSDICNLVKSQGFTQIPNLSSSSPTPSYKFERALNPNTKTTDIPIITDVIPPAVAPVIQVVLPTVATVAPATKDIVVTTTAINDNDNTTGNVVTTTPADNTDTKNVKIQINLNIVKNISNNVVTPVTTETKKNNDIIDNNLFLSYYHKNQKGRFSNMFFR